MPICQQYLGTRSRQPAGEHFAQQNRRQSTSAAYRSPDKEAQADIC